MPPPGLRCGTPDPTGEGWHRGPRVAFPDPVGAPLADQREAGWRCRSCGADPDPDGCWSCRTPISRRTAGMTSGRAATCVWPPAPRGTRAAASRVPRGRSGRRSMVAEDSDEEAPPERDFGNGEHRSMRRAGGRHDESDDGQRRTSGHGEHGLFFLDGTSIRPVGRASTSSVAAPSLSIPVRRSARGRGGGRGAALPRDADGCN